MNATLLEKPPETAVLPPPRPAKRLLRRIIANRYMYILILPGFFYFLLFRIFPMSMLIMAFENYSPYTGVFKSDWVGFQNFITLFQNPHFYVLFRNTLAINILALVFCFPLPIILAILLNEVRVGWFKKLNQTIVYLPHFLSWVVVVSLTFFTLSVDVGVINKILTTLGLKSVSFLSNSSYFWGIITVQTMWKDTGWGTIIFLAAISGVDIQQYEAAALDGAGRLKQIWHITLPAIQPTIAVLLILKIGNLMNVGFEQVLLMMNPLVYNVADVFDTFTYTMGIQQGNISLGVTVGLFKGIVALILVFFSNYIVKKLGNEGIY